MTNEQVRKMVRENGESVSLRLDKFTYASGKFQETAAYKSREIHDICALAGKETVSPQPIPGDEAFEMELGGRLIVNHSGGVLENAGLCLHRFFNYPMIPGSALKGVTRHYASRINAAAADMRRIFGHVDNGGDGGGTIVFLAAVPAGADWRLVPDILTPHPDDRRNPIPVPFIAVEKGAVFRFALKKTRRGTDADLRTASRWLKAALIENGVGGKTAGGYGRFVGAGGGRNIEVKLITPGFFGGADRESAGLRASSLRGLLRYWWRIAMAEHLSDAESKKTENQLWGCTERAGLVRLSIAPIAETVKLFDYKEGSGIKSDFAARHGINPKDSGLHYLAYGMNEGGRPRHYVVAGASWTINLSVRESGLAGLDRGWTAAEVENQALLALSLLCRHGGLGSKSRKGFGSLYWKEAWDLDKCRQVARNFAEPPPAPIFADYSFGKALLAEIDIPTGDAWLALDKLGLAVKLFAGKHKHKPEKAALGLPKQIHGPGPKPLPRQRSDCHRPPLKLGEGRDRFAAPIWYHFEPYGDGMKLNIAAFPSGKVVDERDSQAMLKELLEHLRAKLTPDFFASPGRGNRPQPLRGGANAPPPIINQVGAIKTGSKINGVLLEEKTKKGGWKAKADGLGVGNIQNSDEVPADKKPGDSVNLEVRVAKSDGAAQFKWIP